MNKTIISEIVCIMLWIAVLTPNSHNTANLKLGTVLSWAACKLSVPNDYQATCLIVMLRHITRNSALIECTAVCLCSELTWMSPAKESLEAQGRKKPT